MSNKIRRKKFIDKQGPYRVISHTDGTLRIYPAWTEAGTWDVNEGGGPGIFSRMGLAADIEELLNRAPNDYSPEGYAKREAQYKFIQKYGRLNVIPKPHNTLSSLRREYGKARRDNKRSAR